MSHVPIHARALTHLVAGRCTAQIAADLLTLVTTPPSTLLSISIEPVDMSDPIFNAIVSCICTNQYLRSLTVHVQQHYGGYFGGSYEYKSDLGLIQSSLDSNRTLHHLSVFDGLVNWQDKGCILTLLLRNRRQYTRLRWVWARLSILAAFWRASTLHPFRTSILPFLQPDTFQSLMWSERDDPWHQLYRPDIFHSFSLDRLIDSRYFKSLVSPFTCASSASSFSSSSSLVLPSCKRKRTK